MTLVLKNLQNIIKLNIRRVEKDVNILRKIMRINRFDVSVLFVTNDYIQKLNEQYRHVEGPTDVLAFPALEIAEPGLLPSLNDGMITSDDLSLGDVFLAPAYIKHQCQHHGDDLNVVMMATITHGLCHLKGYDHETEAQHTAMVTEERSILDEFNRLTGHCCTPLAGVGH